MCFQSKNTSWETNFYFVLQNLFFFKYNCNVHCVVQKQPTEVFCKKRCSKKFRKIHRKTPVPVSFFNKVAGSACNLLKMRLWHGCFPVDFAKFLRTSFSQNTSGRLLLVVAFSLVFCLSSSKWFVIFHKIVFKEFQ